MYRGTSKNVEGVTKTYFREKNYFPKKGWAFDGMKEVQ
jgi:hypothetical protein